MKKTITQNCKGQAIVETAFVLMIIVLFTFAITEFGRAMYIKNMLNNAARAGARQAVVTGTQTLPTSQTYNSLPCSSTNMVEQKICDGVFYVKPPSTITTTVEKGTIDTNGIFTSVPGTAMNGDTIRVTVTLNNFQTFALNNIIKALVGNNAIITNTLVGQASMRYE